MPESFDDARPEHRLFPVPLPGHAARPLPDWSAAGCQLLRAIDRLVAGPLLSDGTTAKPRPKRLQTEGKALTDVEHLLGASAAPPPRRGARLEVKDGRRGHRSPGADHVMNPCR